MDTRCFLFPGFESSFFVTGPNGCRTHNTHDLRWSCLTGKQALCLVCTERLPRSQEPPPHPRSREQNCGYFSAENAPQILSVSKGFMTPPNKRLKITTLKYCCREIQSLLDKRVSGEEKHGHAIFCLQFVKVSMKSVKIHERQKLGHDLNRFFLVVLLILNWRDFLGFCFETQFCQDGVPGG